MDIEPCAQCPPPPYCLTHHLHFLVWVCLDTPKHTNTKLFISLKSSPNQNARQPVRDPSTIFGFGLFVLCSRMWIDMIDVTYLFQVKLQV